jgi:hypothetical protein
MTLNDLNQQRGDLIDQIDDLQDRLEEIEKVIQSDVGKQVLESWLLSTLQWSYYNHSQFHWLTLRTPAHKALQNDDINALFTSTFHDIVPLTPDIVLELDDNDLLLVFATKKSYLDVREQFPARISVLKEQKEILERQCNALNDVLVVLSERTSNV